MVVYKRIRKSCLMFEFCLRNQKKKQRILFSGFGFVSLFTNFIFAHTHTHTHTLEEKKNNQHSNFCQPIIFYFQQLFIDQQQQQQPLTYHIHLINQLIYIFHKPNLHSSTFIFIDKHT